MSEQTDGQQAEASRVAMLAVTLAYDGTAYSGFAKQRDPAIATVQGEVERALETVFRCEVPTVCAGRTDAGVHARRQVVSCGVDAESLEDRSLDRLRVSLNALTPDDVSISAVCRVPDGFSARFDAVRREYRYRIVTGPVPSLFLRGVAWWHRSELDVEAMRAGAAHIVGEHDFRSFCRAASAEGKSTVRRVERIDIYEEDQLGESCLVVRVVGNAFLHSMVRTIVGTLVQVGTGRRDPEWVARVLAARDRGAAGETAPACGLTFWNVEYPPGLVDGS